MSISFSNLELSVPANATLVFSFNLGGPSSSHTGRASFIRFTMLSSPMPPLLSLSSSSDNAALTKPGFTIIGATPGTRSQICAARSLTCSRNCSFCLSSSSRSAELAPLRRLSRRACNWFCSLRQSINSSSRPTMCPSALIIAASALVISASTAASFSRTLVSSNARRRSRAIRDNSLASSVMNDVLNTRSKSTAFLPSAISAKALISSPSKKKKSTKSLGRKSCNLSSAAPAVSRAVPSNTTNVSWYPAPCFLQLLSAEITLLPTSQLTFTRAIESGFCRNARRLITPDQFSPSPNTN